LSRVQISLVAIIAVVDSGHPNVCLRQICCASYSPMNSERLLPIQLQMTM
jgi:hypothetical protein